MVVQHNLTAMNSNRMLGLTTAAQAKSTEKLSSGYKINRAADDAAGLAISEKMRKQIRGLTQASANAQDGISAVQTAEGALTEVHDMLQRMNELAVKAANGTNSESDRQAIQSEIDQLVTEIDRVAETTKFNETYLLKGDKDVAKSYSYSYGAVGSTTAAGATMDTDAATGLTVGITFTSGASASDQNTIAMALRDQGVTVSYEEATDEDGNTTQKYSVTLNGAAASNYNVNAMSDSTFEIVDLEGNQIATLTASGGGAVAAADGTPDTADGTPDTTGTPASMELKQGATIYGDDGSGAGYVQIDASNLDQYFSVDDDGNVTATGVKYSTDGVNDDIDFTNGTDQVSTYVDGTAAVPATTGTPASMELVQGATIYGDDGSGAGYVQIDASNLDQYFSVDDDGNVTATGVKYSTDGVNDDIDFTNGTDQVSTYVTGTAAVPADDAADTDDTTTTAAATTATKQSAVITASSITAAQNQGDVAQFYDRDGNAISSNALGNYFSVLSNTTAAADDTPDTTEGTPATTGTPASMELVQGATIYGDDGSGAGYVQIDASNLDQYFSVDDDGNVTATGVKYSTDGVNDDIDFTNGTDQVSTYVTGTAAVPADDATDTDDAADTDDTTTTAAAANVAAKAGSQLYDAVGNTIDMTTAAASVAANQNRVGALNLRLHVGADATSNNQISLNIEAMSAKGLGINGLKVDGTDDSSALSAIETIKEAIQKVSSQRSDLGAVQNRLEHTINNLDNVVENTTSAESQIRDTDMATEMVSYSNNNILAQAGQAMLAQANQSNQGVLSLLG